MGIWLVMHANEGTERSFAMQKPTIVIGRETTCDVRVPVPTVSQKHCQIHLDGDRMKLVDLHSEHGTYHNGNRVEEATLVHEDTLTIGPVTFTVRVRHDDPDHNGNESPMPEIVIERKM